MVNYFKGAGIALFVADLLYFLNVASNIKELPLRQPFQGMYLYIGLFCYLGCILGGLLLYYLQKRNTTPSSSLILFALLGFAYALLIAIFLPFGWKLYFVTVVGSVVFYVAQLLKNKIMTYVFILSGPLLTLLLSSL